MHNGAYFVYIMTNIKNNVFYTGQTNDLLGRVWSHKLGLADGFTNRYRLTKLVYYEPADDRSGALFREKQIKHYLRQKKIALIESKNPSYSDLYIGLVNPQT
jgi:putative endonuclease